MNPTLQPSAEPIPGYRLISRLGRGGYGEVWKVEAPGGMHKAIKFVFGDMESIDGGDAAASAEQEFKSLNRVKSIRHPFILSIERFDIIDGKLMIVMELADKNLLDRFEECRREGMPGIPRTELLRYMEEAAEALDLMNLDHQIQHMDIKPQNLFLVHQHIKVADFGLAKDLEGARAVITGGITPTYAAPESFEGWISKSSDQYSLAIVFQEMLTGVRPLNASNTRQIIHQHLTMRPDVGVLAPPDQQAVLRAMSKTPGDRFPTCTDFVRALNKTGSDLQKRPAVAPTIPDRNTVRQAATVRRTIDGVGSPTNDETIGGSQGGLTAPPSRRLPALVTPRGPTAPVSTQQALQPPAPGKVQAQPSGVPRRTADTEFLRKLNSAPPDRPGDGILSPCILVGLGGAGIETLREFRKKLVEQYGDESMPHFRWVLIDTDASSLAQAQRGTTAESFSKEESLLTRLHRPNYYLNREGLPPIDSWLTPDVLYRIPKNPASDGIRSLGRLALCDHYHVLCQRIRQVIDPYICEAPMKAADDRLKLGVRSYHPRVIITSSSAGGTGSGMFVDVAYLFRRELRQFGFRNSEVIGVLSVPSSTDVVHSANSRATLHELTYFDRSQVVYESRFDTREQPLIESDRPFTTCTLWRGNAADSQTTAAYVHSITLTPLARSIRKTPSNQSTFSVISQHRMANSRPTVVRLSERRIVERLTEEWESAPPGTAPNGVEEKVSRTWSELRGSTAAVRQQLERTFIAAHGRPIQREVDLLVGALPFSGGPVEPTAYAEAAKPLVALLGPPKLSGDDHSGNSQLEVLLSKAAGTVIGDFDVRCSAAVVSFLEQPCGRFTAAEEAIHRFHTLLERGVAELESTVRRHTTDIEKISPVIAEWVTGSSAGQVRSGFKRPNFSPAIIELTREWARKQADLVVDRLLLSVYRSNLGSLPELRRDVSDCRRQYEELKARLLDSSSTPTPTPTPTPTTTSGDYRTPPPAAVATSPEISARRCVESIPLDHWQRIQDDLQAAIKAQFRAFVQVCCHPTENGEAFIELVRQEVRKTVESLVPSLGAAAGFFAAYPDQRGQGEIISRILTETMPNVERAAGCINRTLVAVPADPDGGRFLSAVRKLNTIGAVESFSGGDEILISRTFENVPLTSLPEFSGEADPKTTSGGQRQPASYSRFDIRWGLV